MLHSNLVVCPLDLIQGDDSSVVHGWRVQGDLKFEICEKYLVQNFQMLSQYHSRYNMPHPSLLNGGFKYLCRSYGTLTCVFLEVHTKENPTAMSPWEHTDPLIGNRWRRQAKGKRVLTLPLWLYCDDTSSNQSKKWNEHNSFLFMLAGLPGSETSKEYNIHFICTSNLAPPLEMLDGVVQQIEYIFFGQS